MTVVPIALKVLNIFRNVMTHVGKREAHPIAVELAEKLLPLFNHVSQLLEAEFCGCMLSLLSLLLWTFVGYLLSSAAQPALSLAAWLLVVV